MTQSSAKLVIPAVTMKGDVTGSTSACTVGKLQNIPIKTGTPTDGYLLTYVTADGEWEAKPPPTNYTQPATLVYKTVTINSSSYIVTSTDIIVVLTYNGTITVTLPASSIGRLVYFVITNAVTVYFTNGFSNWLGGSVTTFPYLCVDGTNWVVLNYFGE